MFEVKVTCLNLAHGNVNWKRKHFIKHFTICINCHKDMVGGGAVWSQVTMGSETVLRKLFGISFMPKRCSPKLLKKLKAT